MKHLFGCLVLALSAAGCVLFEPGFVSTLSPYITPDGKQHFRFVVSKALPSDLNVQSPERLHQTLMGNELGRRQYCMNGYDIASIDKTSDPTLVIYEGVCKPPAAT